MAWWKKPAEESKSQTWAYETTTDRLAVGPFSPKPDHQNQVYTAHQRIVHKAGFDASVSVGGSIKEDGTVAYRSISLNQTNFGQTDLAGTPVANRVEQKIAQGDYTCIWTKAKPKEK